MSHTGTLHRLLTTFLVVASGCPYLKKLSSEQEDRSDVVSPHRRLEGQDTTCGSEFCYGRFTPLDVLSPFADITFSELVQIGMPNTDSSLFNYMEDSQARRNVRFLLFLLECLSQRFVL